MTESFKGTLYALLAVAMFATLGTGFKVAVTRMSSYSVVVWIGHLGHPGAVWFSGPGDSGSGSIVAEFRQRPLFFPVAGIDRAGRPADSLPENI